MPSETRREHPFDRERAGSRLALRVSLHGEQAPPEGVVDPPFAWDDVLASDPPGEEAHGPPVLCLKGTEMLLAAVRIENPVLVRFVEGRIEVEDRLSVSPRKLQGVLEAERAVVGQRIEEVKRTAHRRAARTDHPVLERLHRAHAAFLGGVRGLTKGVAALPDHTVVHAQRTATFLSTREGRVRFWRGLADPHGLSGEQKAVTFFILLTSVLVGVAIAHLAVTLTAPDLARPWRTIVLLFLYIFGSSFGLPFPIEPVIVAAALSVGAPAAITAALVGKLLAAWLVFFVGDAIHHRVRERAAQSPRFTRFLEASERFARRFGLVAVAAFIATPGLPDFVPLYLFSSLHMPLGRFMLGVGIGALALYVGFTTGALHLLGLR